MVSGIEAFASMEVMVLSAIKDWSLVLFLTFRGAGGGGGTFASPAATLRVQGKTDEPWAAELE